MFHHVKELQFNARVSEPDPRFATLLLEQFGGSNGELKACMQYFVQAFAARQPFPEHYDLLMDIAAEELSHLEIVGATIQMLLGGLNGELKNAVERIEWMDIVTSKAKKEELIHQVAVNPQFGVLTGGAPQLTDSQGVPWTAAYVNANGDLTVDLRSNIAAESRAKIVYEYLMQFTDDAYVKETLSFLMTREIAHFKMFQAALEAIPANFPPGVLQGDPRFSHTFFNMSNGADARGPWNQGQGPWPAGENWVYVADPIAHVTATHGLVDQPQNGADGLTAKQVAALDKKMSKARSAEIKAAMPKGGIANQWSSYPQAKLESPMKIEDTKTRS